MYISVVGTDKAGMAEIRSANFDAFTEFLHNHPDFPEVKLHHGGPLLAADGETPIGTQLVLEAPSIEAAENFINASPFGKEDLYEHLHIRQWRWLTGRPD